MPEPRKGDVLDWSGSVWKLVSDVERSYSTEPFCARGKLIEKSPLDYGPWRVGEVHTVYFSDEVLENTQWTLVEDPFVTFVKDTLAEHEEKACLTHKNGKSG